MVGATEPAEERLRLVLGLGNPGSEYRGSRHNLGFEVVDELASRSDSPVDRLECNSLVSELPGVLLAKPQTYMNRSGYAAACLCDRRDIEPEDVLVVIDDVALPLGSLRMRRGGSPGGHRGLESVVESLRTDRIPRLRLGIREGEMVPEGDELVDFVLGPFDESDRDMVDEMLGRAADACLAWIENGIEEAMNRFNG